MSLARRHKERVLAALNAASAPNGGSAIVPAATPPPAARANTSLPADRAAAQIALRLTHDLRRLKEIRSIDRKIEAKREMLPEYRAWIEGVVATDVGAGAGIAAEVLPTCMVWLIDVGAYAEALDLVPFILRHSVSMPSRYQRDAATIIVEEIADAALKSQNGGTAFPLDILERVDWLTADLDLHDEVRAKLMKAMGIEQLRVAEELPAEESRAALETTLASLRAAQRLNDRVGVKDRIKRADKLLATSARLDTNNEQTDPLTPEQAP